MIHPKIQPVVRRAILDLIEDVGGEINDDTATILLNELGHRVGGPDVVIELRWLADRDLLKLQEYGALVVVSSTSAGLAGARGTMTFEGVSRHKTGE